MSKFFSEWWLTMSKVYNAHTHYEWWFTMSKVFSERQLHSEWWLTMSKYFFLSAS